MNLIRAIKTGFDLWLEDVNLPNDSGHGLSLFREIRDSIKYWYWDKQMGDRKSENELWIWDDISVNGVWTKQITVLPRPKNWQQLLVSIKLSDSNSDAQRRIKSGGIQSRSWCLGDEPWVKINSLTFPLPIEPTYVRIGKQYSATLVWLPPVRISQKQGEEMFRKFAF